MKQNEKEYLIKERLNGGMAENIAFDEVKTFQQSQKQFKILFRENYRLKKQMEKLEKELESKTGFKESFKQLKSEKVQQGSLYHLRRILNNMEKNKHYMLKNLAAELCMGSNDLNECLEFLEEYKLIKLEHPKVGGVILI